ncbi:MAG TPA: YfbU family protein [Candidatus Saccharimonadales bacterium]|nr:YfbU family protein [Candidatus Saccharimonadales bacterium]
MSQITVSLPDDLAEKVRIAATAAGYATVSDFVRDALREKFSGLSYWQRVQLVMSLKNNKILHGIADHLGIEGVDQWSHEDVLESLKNGYTDDYNKIDQLVAKNELGKEQSDFVHDLFDMFADMQRAAEQLKDKELQKQVVFPGFDGNNEFDYMGYAMFLLDGLKLYQYLKRAPSLNTHTPGMVMSYRGMLDRWKVIKGRHNQFGYTLNTEEVKEILGDDGGMVTLVNSFNEKRG